MSPRRPKTPRRSLGRGLAALLPTRRAASEVRLALRWNENELYAGQVKLARVLGCPATGWTWQSTCVLAPLLPKKPERSAATARRKCMAAVRRALTTNPRSP